MKFEQSVQTKPNTLTNSSIQTEKVYYYEKYEKLILLKQFCSQKLRFLDTNCFVRLITNELKEIEKELKMLDNTNIEKYIE